MRWSNYLSKLLLASGMLVASHMIYAQDTLEIFDMEYYFDVDPGFGSATGITISPDSTISLTELLSTSALPTGFHTLGVRARNVPFSPEFNVLDTGSQIVEPYLFIDPALRTAGQWGMTETRLVFVDQSDAGSIVNVDQIEYFFDVDPGVGSASQVAPFSANNMISIVESLNSDTLSFGFHVLGMRARAVGGAWGTTETRLIFVDQSDAGGIINVDQIEYFFDVDPGVGSASQVAPFSANNTISIVESLNSDTLSFGFHVLGMRARAVGGAWGTTETRLIFVDQSDAGGIINVDQIEYFFDVDPGVGSASQVAPFTASNSVAIVESLNTDTLSFGFHTLGMRARSEGGAWGITETRLLFVDKTQGVINVDQIEYFFDTDPGVGIATQITGFTAANSISIVENLTSNALLPGFHVLGMRARSESGSWGTTETRLIFVDKAGTISNVSEFEYFIGNDPGVGNATSIAVGVPAPQVNENVTLNTDTVTIGNYQIHFRARNSNGDWGLTESRPFQVVNMAAPVITSAESIPTNTTPLNMTVSFGEAVNGFDQTDITVSTGGSLQGGSFTTVNDSSFTFLLDLTTEGLITVDIADSAATAQDDGTPSPTAETFKVIYDVTAPVVTVDTVFTIDTSPALSGTVDNDSVSVGITVDGSTYNASSVSGGIWTLNAGTITALRNGVYDVLVQATDSASNVGTDTTINELTIDILEVTIDTLSTSDTSPELTGMVTDTAATVDVTVDGSTYAATVNSDSTWTLAAGTITPPLAEGTYDVVAAADRGVEGVVNDITTDELIIFSIDVLTSVDPLSTNNRSPALTGTISELSATIDITIDGATYSAVNNGDNTWSLAAGIITPDLSDGIYDVEVLADAAGNLGSDSTINEIRVDGTAPIITVDLVATSISSPALSGSIDDPSADIELTVDGNNYVAINNGDDTWSLPTSTISPALADGTYSIDATATDSLGNEGVDQTSDELIITSTLLALPATEIMSTSFLASWSEGEDVLNYELDVSTLSDFSTMLDGYESLVVNSTSVMVTDLDFASSYYYRVRLVNTASEVSNNSNFISLKTTIDDETIADSTALVQIFNALDGPNWTTPVNWESGRLRDWDGVSLDVTKTRVSQLDIINQNATGSMPNPFTGDAIGGLSSTTSINLSNNQIESLIDFAETNVSDLDVSNNALDFADLEPLIGITSLTYSPQANLFFDQSIEDFSIETPHLSDTSLVVTAGGTFSNYAFLRNDAPITSGEDFNVIDSALFILSIDFENMGEFRAEVSNTQLPDLTLQVEPQIVYAVADLAMTIVDGSGDFLEDAISAYLLEAVRRSQGFDTLVRADNQASTFVFSDVVLGNYLCSIDPDNKDIFIPTYFGDDVEWTLADTVFFREADNVQVVMTEIPSDPVSGPGVLSVLIEEDFSEDEGRIDARRRAARRKCGLRRKTGGGRTSDDDFELIAYGETNDNGEFEFGFLPEGTYRFFVEYPGIPLDPSSEVEFEVGEEGISDTEFKLEAFVNEDGIEVTIDRVLGNILSYFKNLQVYPNPTTDLIKITYRHLNSADLSFHLLDLSGNIIRTLKMKSGFEGYEELDVSELSKGIYLLNIFDRNNQNESVITYRLIVK